MWIPPCEEVLKSTQKVGSIYNHILMKVAFINGVPINGVKR